MYLTKNFRNKFHRGGKKSRKLRRKRKISKKRKSLKSKSRIFRKRKSLKKYRSYHDGKRLPAMRRRSTHGAGRTRKFGKISGGTAAPAGIELVDPRQAAAASLRLVIDNDLGHDHHGHLAAAIKLAEKTGVDDEDLLQEAAEKLRKLDVRAWSSAEAREELQREWRRHLDDTAPSPRAWTAPPPRATPASAYSASIGEYGGGGGGSPVRLP